jgi:hypothetical protein
MVHSRLDTEALEKDMNLVHELLSLAIDYRGPLELLHM